MRPMDKQEWSRQRFPALLDSAPHRIQGGPPKIKRTNRDTLKGNIFFTKDFYCSTELQSIFSKLQFTQVHFKISQVCKIKFCSGSYFQSMSLSFSRHLYLSFDTPCHLNSKGEIPLPWG
jgi:hypothetical protein